MIYVVLSAKSACKLDKFDIISRGYVWIQVFVRLFQDLHGYLCKFWIESLNFNQWKLRKKWFMSNFPFNYVWITVKTWLHLTLGYNAFFADSVSRFFQRKNGLIRVRMSDFKCYKWLLKLTFQICLNKDNIGWSDNSYKEHSVLRKYI